jgi:hypothetical protein
MKTSGMTKKRKKTVTGFPMKTFGNDKQGSTEMNSRQLTYKDFKIINRGALL